MRGFIENMQDMDPVDAADSLVDFLRDLIATSHASLSLVQYEPKKARELAEASVRTLAVAIAITDRLQDGVDELARLAKRGTWTAQQVTVQSAPPQWQGRAWTQRVS